MDKSGKHEEHAAIKKECINDDIKEFAESTMNELLGWYGYAKERDLPRTGSYKSHSNSNSSGPDSPKYTEGCGWCGKPVDESNGLSSGSAYFCSELCFSQSRRANFKKNKTCDWCRHVRHTVSYVDFQDGASQLQFCSDKCLNQYKMHIFCRETRAHLEMHPHLTATEETTSTSTLITPELWLKNCKSSNSRSPSPTSPPSPPIIPPQTSPLPLITVAHPSKLLASPPDAIKTKNVRCKRMRMRKRMPSTVTRIIDVGVDLNVAEDLRVNPQQNSPLNLEAKERKFESSAKPARLNHEENARSEERTFPPPCMNNILPPVTVMVPYPIMIPIPIPIPIPLPLSCFAKAAELKLDKAEEDKVNGDAVSSRDEAEAEGEVIDVVNDVEEEEVKEEVPVQTRPLRKRKRVVDAKSKLVVKTKKTLSV